MEYHVVLDYGHGGSKSGAVYNGAVEKQLNYLTGSQIYSSLHEHEQRRRIRILLTRDEDYDVPLRTRCDLINQCNVKHQVDLAVSVHFNAASVASAQGFEIFYLNGSDNGAKAAKSILESVKSSDIQIRGKGMKTTKDLGRKLAFIHKITPPAVLIEVGFLTNETDRDNAMKPEYRKYVADSIAQGIWQYLDGQGEA